MLFDTGSCEFWIPSNKCNSSRCKTHNRYSKSNSYEDYQNAQMSIQYLSGKVQGNMGKETIIIGDLKVEKQVIGIADEVLIPLLDEVIWDGILGLAYPNANLKKQNIKPIFDNIIIQKILTDKGEKNQFSYFLGPDNGAISFGGADMKYKYKIDDEFMWAPIVEENYWTISLIDVRKEKNIENEIKNSTENKPPIRFVDKMRFSENDIKLCPGGCKAIVDTGTYLIYGPQDQIQNYLSDLTLDNCSNKNKLPNLIFEFLGEKGENGEQKHIELTLTPNDYVLQFKIDGEDDCVIGIGPDSDDTGWTLGQVFLKTFYTVFDRDYNRIGFVRSSTSPKIIKKEEEINNKNGNLFNLFKTNNTNDDSKKEKFEEEKNVINLEKNSKLNELKNGPLNSSLEFQYKEKYISPKIIKHLVQKNKQKII